MLLGKWLEIGTGVARTVRPVGILDWPDYRQAACHKVMILWHTIDRRTPLGYVATSVRNHLINLIRAERRRVCQEYDDSMGKWYDPACTLLTPLEEKLIRYRMSGKSLREIAALEGCMYYEIQKRYRDLRSRLTELEPKKRTGVRTREE